MMLNALRRRFAGEPASTFGLIDRVLREYGPAHWRRFALAFLLMGLAAACTAGIAFLIGHVINVTYIGRDMAGVAGVAVAAMVLFCAKGVSSYGQAVILASVANRINADNQKRLVDSLLRQDMRFFSDRHSSEFTARLAFGSVAAAHVLNILVTALGRDLLTLIGLAIVMAMQAPALSLVALIVMPPAVLSVRYLVQRVRTIARTEFAGGARIVETLQETVQGLRIVKALNIEDQMRRRVAESADSIELAANRMAQLSNRSSPLMETLGGLAIALMMVYGGYQVLVLDRPPGEFVSFMAAFLLAYEPAKRIARLNIDLGGALVGVQMLFEVLDLPAGDDDGRKPPLKLADGSITFRDVRFSYRQQLPVLEGMSFVAEPRRITALVGPSGGGKTTIFNLLLRFYDVEHGEILIDGQNIAGVSRGSLRDQTAYVGQDVFLFRGSVRENIAYGRIGATDADIIVAAKAAHAHDFIMDLPAGYDSPVGEHGLQLSGGQRQRIAIARAFIRNARIVLLDEPTASLDAESERHIQAAVAHLAEGRTTLVIAHRLHTIRNADVIHLVERGRIVESGTHVQLMAVSRRYATLYNLQFGAEAASSEAAATIR